MLCLLPGRVFNVSTLSQYSYSQAWLTTLAVDHVILRIKACRDAHILLSEQIGLSNNTYEAALGIIGNTKSVLRDSPYGNNMIMVDTPGIMSCDEFR